jgi:solute carrier family 50 protein (sugar transporter)
MYGFLKEAPSVLYSNSVGLILALYYCFMFTKYCGPMASNLPGTVSQHIKGASAIILFNVLLAGSLQKDTSSEMIGKEGVLICIILFASPLAALKHVIMSKSAASIPLPFTVACFFNCVTWSAVGLWVMKDFNIYFPNLLGLSSAVAQLGLKAFYGDRVKDLPK